jgi:hypothetical protein
MNVRGARLSTEWAGCGKVGETAAP